MRISTGSTHPGGHWFDQAPPAPILAVSFLLAGLGTVVLGPLLPALLQEWHLSDGRGGLLLLAKFVGAFCGGAAVPSRLRLGTFAGHLIAAAGFACFALAPGVAIAMPALFLTGLGLGEIIASTNILAGRRWTRHPGSALAALNFFWSLGAVSTGLIVAAVLPRLGWRKPAAVLAVLFALTGLLTLIPDKAPDPPASDLTASPPATQNAGTGVLASFAALLFLYGGLETCLTAWLTTFSLRFAGGHLLGGQSGFVVLWMALTAGRLLASALMRRWPERLVQRVSLVACLVLIACLSATGSAIGLTGCCVLLGLALAPVFPSTFGLLLRHNVAARTAGLLLAVSGLGAALFPWLMGVVSTHFGSLRVAMAVPALLIPAMLVLTRAEAAGSAAKS